MFRAQPLLRILSWIATNMFALMISRGAAAGMNTHPALHDDLGKADNGETLVQYQLSQQLFRFVENRGQLVYNMDEYQPDPSQSDAQNRELRLAIDHDQKMVSLVTCIIGFTMSLFFDGHV